jgi:hypothetical protein
MIIIGLSSEDNIVIFPLKLCVLGSLLGLLFAASALDT